MGLLFIKLSSVFCLIRDRHPNREESVAASVVLGCARTRYFNMLPSRLDGFGSDNCLSFFSESADMFLLTRGSDQINAYLNQRPTMSFYDKAFQ